MPSKLATDPRIDPRIKRMFVEIDFGAGGNVASREVLLAEENTEAAKARMAGLKQMMDAYDNETIAPSTGLTTRTELVVSDPDRNTIKIQFIRPDNDVRVPCVYYIHGGGMRMMSCYDGNYRAWGRTIAS